MVGREAGSRTNNWRQSRWHQSNIDCSAQPGPVRDGSRRKLAKAAGAPDVQIVIVVGAAELTACVHAGERLLADEGFWPGPTEVSTAAEN